jgi:hypothetical protein
MGWSVDRKSLIVKAQEKPAHGAMNASDGLLVPE